MHHGVIKKRIGQTLGWVCGLLFISVLLGSCSSQTQQTTTGTRTLAERYSDYGQVLRGRDVRAIQVGDDQTWVLPVDKFFYPHSPNLNTDTDTTLSAIANILRSYEKISVKIAGYTDNVGSRARNLALSKRRAQAIADYLWQQGVDTRLLVSTGYGESQPIASNSSSDGRAQNRRVIITFREIKD